MYIKKIKWSLLINENIKQNVFCSSSKSYIVKLGNVDRRKNSRIPLVLETATLELAASIFPVSYYSILSTQDLQWMGPGETWKLIEKIENSVGWDAAIAKETTVQKNAHGINTDIQSPLQRTCCHKIREDNGQEDHWINLPIWVGYLLFSKTHLNELFLKKICLFLCVWLWYMYVY